MTTRQALIIGAPGRYKNYLPGVKVDIRTMKSYLMSAQGGGWYDHEILVLEDPDFAEIEAAMQNMYADYTITLFAGHGFSHSATERYLSLSNGDYFQDLYLLNASPKQLVLIDACRNVIPKGIYGDPFADEEFSHFDGGEYNIKRSRAIYDKLINEMADGQVIIHSTLHNKSAGDSEMGGIFSQSLLQIAYALPRIENKYNTSSCYRTANNALKLMRSNGKSQTPQITYSNGNTHLPFAIALPKFKFNLKRGIVPKPNPQPNYAGWAFGLIVLGIVLSSGE